MNAYWPEHEARSPWSAHYDKPEAAVHPPGSPIIGAIRMPGSKSLTNRALILASLAEGGSQIQGILRSDDSYWCVQALSRLGVPLTVKGELALIGGTGGVWPNPAGNLYAGAAGTVARFLPGALAAGEGVWTLNGSSRLRERPLAPLLAALEQLGARLVYEAEKGCLPLTLHANGLAGGEVALPGSVSSQFISGLLLAAPYARRPLTIRVEGEVVQHDYVRMTMELMTAFGVTPESSADGQSITVPTGRYRGQSITLEPDISTCCYFWAMAALTAGRVRIYGIPAADTTQPDMEMLDALAHMGCTVRRGADFAEVQGPEQLKGGFTLSMKRWSDQTLTLAAIAPFADGPITLKDAAHIKHHECDRLAAICAELGKLGICVEEHHDGLTIHPGRPKPALLDSHDDHRMAMALALIGMKVPVRIANPGCVSKTCPDYFERLAALGAGIQI